jgi:hypothetical protein
MMKDDQARDVDQARIDAAVWIRDPMRRAGRSENGDRKLNGDRTLIDDRETRQKNHGNRRLRLKLEEIRPVLATISH